MNDVRPAFPTASTAPKGTAPSIRFGLTRSLALTVIVLFVTGVSIVGAQTSEARTWTKKSFAVQGTWQIIEEGGQKILVLSDDFKTRSAPDLKLFLSKHSVADAGNRNATDGSVLIAPLQSNKGTQRYVLPSGIDIKDFSSLLLHCEQYSKLWAAAELAPKS